MQKSFSLLRKGFTPYGNNFDPLIPELWAFESIAILEEEMVIGNLVNRDYNDVVAKYGHTIHTDKPGEFRAIRKTTADDVTVQDATTTDIEVKLNQWLHVSFTIKDGEQAYVFQDLVRKYLHPAMLANARFLDQALLGHAAVGFLPYARGGLGQLGATTAKDYLIDLDDAMNQNKAWGGSNRNLILSSSSKAAALKAELFHAADKMGDGGRAMREAELGRKFGFNTFMGLNTPHVTSATMASTTTTAAAAAAGASSVTASAAIAKGAWFTIDGDYTPYRATTATTTLTPDRTFRNAIASGAVVRPVATGAINNASGYAADYVGAITVDGTGVPKVGQLVAFNSGDTATGTLRTAVYTIVQVVSATSIVLDRPLEVALTDNDAVCYGPNGDLNVAFTRDAMTLVNRPMALPMPGAGARSAFASYNGLSMRVVIAYEPRSQGHIVTLDSLFGIKVVEPLLGATLLG